MGNIVPKFIHPPTMKVQFLNYNNVPNMKIEYIVPVFLVPPNKGDFKYSNILANKKENVKIESIGPLFLALSVPHVLKQKYKHFVLNEGNIIYISNLAHRNI